MSSHGGDAREAVKALIVANHFLETGKTAVLGLDGLCARQAAAWSQGLVWL